MKNKVRIFLTGLVFLNGISLLGEEGRIKYSDRCNDGDKQGNHKVTVWNRTPNLITVGHFTSYNFHQGDIEIGKNEAAVFCLDGGHAECSKDIWWRVKGGVLVLAASAGVVHKEMLLDVLMSNIISLQPMNQRIMVM